MSRAERKSTKKQNHKSKSNSESDSSKKKTFQGKSFKCGEKGHLRKDCLARVIAHPTQTGKSEDDEDENGEKSSLVLLSQISLNNSSDLTCLEEFYDAILRECLFSDDTVREYSSLIRKDRCVKDWYADTGTAFHMTDYLSCMKDVKPCHKMVLVVLMV